MKGNPRNTTRLISPVTYMIGSGDDNIDVDTALGATTIYIPNIQASGLTLVDKKYYINDVTGNAQANPITIVCLGGNTINNGANLVLNENGISAQIVIADQNRYIANLNTDSGGGGGGTIGGGGTLNYVAMFTPDGTHIGNAPIKVGDVVSRSLPVNTGTNSIGIGYDIVMSGTDSMLIGYGLQDGGGQEVFALGSRLNITAAVAPYGVIALGFANTIQGVSSTQGIYLIGDSNVIEDNLFSSCIGEGNTLTRNGQVTIIGLSNSVSDSTYIQNIGLSNVYSFSNNCDIIGSGNTLNNSSSINILGDFNTLDTITNATIVGDGNSGANSNEIFVGLSDQGIRVNNLGYVGIGVPFVSTITDNLEVVGKIKFKSTSDFFGTPILKIQNASDNANVLFNDDGNMYINSPQYTGIAWQVGGANVTQIITTGADIAKHRLPTDWSWVRRNDDFILGGKSGVNWFFQAAAGSVITPSAKVHIQGESATLADYALKVDNLASTNLLYVRNDSFVGVGVSTPVDIENMRVAGYIRSGSGMALNGALLINNCYTLMATGSVYWSSGDNIDTPVGAMRFTNPSNEFRFSNSTYTYNHVNIISNNTIFTPLPATSVSVLSPEYSLNIRSSYWNGIATINNDGIIKNTPTDVLGNYKLGFFIGGSEKAYIHSNGTINASGLQIGNVGLVSGDLYVDSAANILANGDLIVGRKV